MEWSAKKWFQLSGQQDGEAGATVRHKFDFQQDVLRDDTKRESLARRAGSDFRNLNSI